VLDRVTTGPKPDLVKSLGATYHSGAMANLGFEPDIIIECTGVGQVISDCFLYIGAGGAITRIGSRRLDGAASTGWWSSCNARWTAPRGSQRGYPPPSTRLQPVTQCPRVVPDGAAITRSHGSSSPSKRRRPARSGASARGWLIGPEVAEASCRLHRTQRRAGGPHRGRTRRSRPPHAGAVGPRVAGGSTRPVLPAARADPAAELRAQATRAGERLLDWLAHQGREGSRRSLAREDALSELRCPAVGCTGRAAGRGRPRGCPPARGREALRERA
jgi:hypothetical protein